MSKAHYPFTAVCGQTEFKLALMLAAINPAIGGVVISGPRGSAKSTLARGMADLLPAHQQAEGEQQVPAEFVTLPLGASEEMLLGTLDLAQVLNEKKIQFSPGLLSRAHGGVLYVDEVNLLPDNLVDLLLDVSTSGVNRVERDGISHSHRAEFLLVGTMNPDEGELRPQLHDRFGLSVDLSNQYTPAERVEIVKRREQFDRNPQAFLHSYASQQAALIQQILSARQQLSAVECSDALRLSIAERCSEAQVDGLRADIVWFRAALAHAALEQRSAVQMSDIDAVEELVLAHRRKAPPSQQKPSQPPPPEPPSGSPFKRPENTQQPASAQGEWGAMPPQQQKTAERVELILPEPEPAKRQGSGSQASPVKSSRPDWFKTLLGSLPNWPPQQLRYRQQRLGRDCLHLVLLDTSASTLQGSAFAHAKAALLQISEQAYLKRQQIALFGFGNSQVENLLSRVRAPKELRSWLDNLGAGGGTPMRQAFLQARDYLQQLRKQQPELQVRCYVLSDGRSSSSLEGIELGADLIWIDTELSQVKRGRGRRFAAELNAAYFALAGA
ncbi:ATP-binding protein [Neptuniibacter halophilus]|uniref:ATP-binding protein n=1 Tax=Neptuniibacter halophilus TaxID=651666 RepID=UPI0025727257|nr:ATP-binding protein [Neptuniibacter halophilus]